MLSHDKISIQNDCGTNVHAGPPGLPLHNIVRYNPPRPLHVADNKTVQQIGQGTLYITFVIIIM